MRSSDLGAPWLDARALVALLADRGLPGVRFTAEQFVPHAPTDGKYRRPPDRRASASMSPTETPFTPGA